MAQALLTAVVLGLAGLVTTAVYGLLGTDVARHISFGIFSTMITLLAHSMMMFYLIGKGKAVKDAMAESQLTGDFFRFIDFQTRPNTHTPGGQCVDNRRCGAQHVHDYRYAAGEPLRRR